MKKIFLFLFFFISLFAEQINKYDVSLNVSQNGKLSITETITYDFGTLKKHGIFRFIPILRGKPENIDATMDNNKATFVTAIKDNKLFIRIGDADKLITGIHTYKINYTMDRVVRKYNDKLNTIRFNAIGTEWKIPIENVKVSLKLSTILKNATIKTFTGVYGSTSTTAKIEKIDDFKYSITMEYLPPKNGLTVGIYFDKSLIKAYKKPEPNNLWVFFFLVIFSIGSYFYYKKHIVHLGAIAPQYYPPENFDILQSGVLIDEEFDDKDVTAAILELALKGHLKIEKNKSGKTILKKTTSDKNLTPFLQNLYNSLFMKSDTLILGKQSIKTAKRMRDRISSLKDKIFNWCIEKKYFYQTPTSAKSKFFIVNLLVALPFIIFSAYQTFSIVNEDEKGIILFLVSDIIFVFIALFAVKSKLQRIVFTISPLIPLILLSKEFLGIIKYPFPLILLSLIPIIYFTSKVDVYTPKGAESLRYLLGFKDFIQKVEENRIRIFLKKDPEYLDKVLPYAVLFGVSKHWLELYSQLNEKIEWYEGSKDYFYGVYDSLYDDFETTKNYKKPSKSESVSFNFGGSDSSGGGSGGGGGGSW